LRKTVEATILYRDRPGYPSSVLKSFGADAPERLSLLGKPELLGLPLLGLFCSMKCPGSLILKAVDTCRALREENVPVVSGFHSPVEKECLTLLLRGTQPIVYCPARSIETMLLKDACKKPLEDNRLLILSTFDRTEKRATEEIAEKRNRFVAMLAGAVLVFCATPGGKLEMLCREIIEKGTPVYTFDSERNKNLLEIGATPFHMTVKSDGNPSA
jgi:predicted Rossmann fold nucleotide-binding protein DprA/Smf involved in DNA uptake